MKQFIVRKEWSDGLADYIWCIYRQGEDNILQYLYSKATLDEIKAWKERTENHYIGEGVKVEIRKE